MIPHEVNKKNNFIMGFYQDSKLTDEIEDFFLTYKKMGLTRPGILGDGRCNPKIKESNEVLLNDNPSLWTRYLMDCLQPILEEYLKKYPECNNVCKFNITETINIQEYAPNSQAYNHWHSERTGIKSATRFLVFLTYLNDVEDEGQTAFLFQDVLIKPEKGLTLIWPSDWPFTHKGLPSKTEYKRVVTGWFAFIE